MKHLEIILDTANVGSIRPTESSASQAAYNCLNPTFRINMYNTAEWHIEICDCSPPVSVAAHLPHQRSSPDVIDVAAAAGAAAATAGKFLTRQPQPCTA